MQSEIYNITRFPFSMNQFLSPSSFSQSIFHLLPRRRGTYESARHQMMIYRRHETGQKIWEMPSGNVLVVIALADKRGYFYSIIIHNTIAQSENYFCKYLSHSSPLPWLKPVFVVLIHIRWWCVYHLFIYFLTEESEKHRSLAARKNMPRVTDNNPLYWQAFHTDQHLMGFIINRDDSFFPAA